MNFQKQIISLIAKEFEKLPDSRSKEKLIYTMSDITLSAFAMYYFQNPSWLDFARKMNTKSGKSNAKSLFGIKKIPSDNHVRDTLDDIDSDKLQPTFDKIYKLLLEKKTLEKYTYFDNKTLLVLLDGTYYHSSTKIHCEHCQTRKKTDTKGSETLQYYHSAITPIIAKPKTNTILPLLPEMISNTDGDDKQDCEINASKRWLDKTHILAKKYKLVLLGDDLYSKTSLIKKIREKEYNYIFVCKETSHKKLYETVHMVDNLGNMDTKTATKLNKQRKKESYNYKYLHEVELTGEKNPIKVNWCSVEVKEVKGKIIYSGAFITDYIIKDENVEEIVEAGRARWKIENENNNTLKTGGYNLEHNFGHGKKGLSELLFVFNILAFLTHTLCLTYDDDYKELYGLINKRKTFFNHINTFTTFFYFLDWDILYQTMIKGYIDGIHLD